MRLGLLGNPTPACNEMDIGVRGRERGHGQANWTSSRRGRTHTRGEEDLQYLTKFGGMKIRLVGHRNRKFKPAFWDNYRSNICKYYNFVVFIYLVSLQFHNFTDLCLTTVKKKAHTR